MTSLLIEGGAQLYTSAIATNSVDKIAAYIAPKLLGGIESLSPIGEIGTNVLTQAKQLSDLSIRKLGNDAYISAYLNSPTTWPMPGEK